MRTPGGTGAGVLPILVALSIGGAVAGACGDGGSSSPGSQGGDDVINDTRDSSVRAPGNPDPGDGSVATGEPDAQYASGQPDGGTYTEGDSGYGEYDAGPAPASYPGVAECSACSCPATTSYCFGGATPRHDPMIVRPYAADAGPPCPLVAAGALGCTALPAGSTSCSSLIVALQPTYSCYLVCAYDGTTMTAYCPNP
jgi:hypothetical protein